MSAVSVGLPVAKNAVETTAVLALLVGLEKARLGAVWCLGFPGWWTKAYGSRVECWAPLDYQGPCAKRQAGLGVMSLPDKKVGALIDMACFFSGRMVLQDFELNCAVSCLAWIFCERSVQGFLVCKSSAVHDWPWAVDEVFLAAAVRRVPVCMTHLVLLVGLWWTVGRGTH